jgi:hypothetical protein
MNYVYVWLFSIVEYKQTINKRKKEKERKMSIRHLTIREIFIGTNHIEFITFFFYLYN